MPVQSNYKRYRDGRSNQKPKQVETREQEDIQSFPARIPYILIICTHKYYYYHFWHIYLILIISTHKYILSFLARIPYTYHFHTQIYIIISGTYTVYTYHFYTHIYIYRPIYHDNISAPDITKTMLDVEHSV